MTVRRAVFTALLGGYETLNEPEVAVDGGIDFVCFTDDDSLRSSKWRIVVVEPMLPLDLVRSQRYLKLIGQPLLQDYEEHLYIDKCVSLRVDPGLVLDDWLAHHDIAVVDHSEREHVIDEFDAVIDLGYDEVGRVHERLLHCSELYPDVLQERPAWNAFSARRNAPQVREALELWFDHVLRYSRRDRLSSNVALALSGLPVRRVALDNRRSPVHTWPTELGRVSPPTRVTDRGPLLAEIARLRRELETTRREHDEIARREHESEKLRAAANSESSALRAQPDALQVTLSWRVTWPLRAIRRLRPPGDASR